MGAVVSFLYFFKNNVCWGYLESKMIIGYFFLMNKKEKTRQLILIFAGMAPFFFHTHYHLGETCFLKASNSTHLLYFGINLRSIAAFFN